MVQMKSNGKGGSKKEDGTGGICAAPAGKKLLDQKKFIRCGEGAGLCIEMFGIAGALKKRGERIALPFF